MYVGGGLQGMGILANRSPFQLGALAGVTDPAISEVIRWMESVTGITAGTTYDNGVFGGGDPTVFGMPASVGLDEAKATKMAIAGISNREPNALIAGLSSSNAFIRNLAMKQIVAVFDNGMGGPGQGAAIYLQSPPTVAAAIKAAWLAANGGGQAAQDAWFRLIEQPKMEARINELFQKSNFGQGSPFRVEQGHIVRDLVTDKVVGDLADPSFSIDALVASVRDREMKRIQDAISAGQTTAAQAAQSIANTATSTASPPPPSIERQNAPQYIAPGATTPSAMPASLPTNTPPVTPATVNQIVDEATAAATNIPSDGGEAVAPFIPAGAGGATTGGGSYMPAGGGGGGGIETAVPTSATPPVLTAGAGTLTNTQKVLAGAAILGAILFTRKKGK